MRKILALFLGLMFLTQVVCSSPSTTISVPNPAIANTVIQSSNYNGNNNEIQSKYNAHTHADITALGTVTSGAWAGSPIPIQYGGTGSDYSTATQGTILYFNGTGTLTKRVASASGLALITKGNSADPVWEKVGLTSSVLGVLGLTNGGTASIGENLVKGWASVTVAGGTPTLQDSYNVSGITDTGTGLLTVTWDTDFASTNYAVVQSTLAAASPNPNTSNVTTVAVGSCVLACVDVGAAPNPRDPSAYYCIAVGDQ